MSQVDTFDYEDVPARIRFLPAKGYIEITDRDELKALIEALVIRLHWGSKGNKRREYQLFSEFHTREYVEGFLLGRRHALLQDLGPNVSSQPYNERGQARSHAHQEARTIVREFVTQRELK